MLLRTILALLLLLPAAAASAQDLDAAVSAVVRISGTRGDTPVRGSGFVVGLDPDKATIVTAAHVVEGVQQLEVTFAADLTESFPAGSVLGLDSGSRRGLAVFQVRGALPSGVTTLSFETEAQLQRGEDLFLLGFPHMSLAPLTLRRTFAGPNGNLLQLDLSVGEGFSGAPVLRKGKVVGVVTDEDPQITFAVKALVARDAVAGWQVRLGGQSSGSVTTTAKPPVSVDKKCVPGEERTEKGIVFVRICPGTFTMGSGANDPPAKDDEKPAHEVTLTSGFWMGKTEITNEQYRRFRSDHRGDANLPAVDVTWADAKEACEHFGGRLPTEAEWEYSARAGSQTAWSFGDDETRLGEYAWYEGNRSVFAPQPVGMKKPNAWGLQDMHGNVWEWVADRYALYTSEAQTDPAGPTNGDSRILRGGSFVMGPEFARSAQRFGRSPEVRYPFIGFRCVLAPRGGA
ncbi:MAG TPA: SUMF1/EgtB/PvdO family nonheme iron enzyme [Thermoanaerobaculia bacterium]|nr:SUMF1/EgtB/PvdO family nonheme iron enzyme [Thermoanaerobaculia bacterium]